MMLTPVEKKMVTCVSRSTGRVRRECWSAESNDGIWAYERAEDQGTRWYLIHIPTGWTILGGHGTLRAARSDTATGDALLDLWLDAHRALLTLSGGVGNHDRARVVLAWLAAHEPRIVQIAESRVRARQLHETAVRFWHLAEDLGRQLAEDAGPGSPDGQIPDARLSSLRDQYARYAEVANLEAADLGESARRLHRADFAARVEVLRTR